eukprot:1346108-Amorphochlora_amoeboformis.AAC.1
MDISHIKHMPWRARDSRMDDLYDDVDTTTGGKDSKNAQFDLYDDPPEFKHQITSNHNVSAS